MRYAALGLCALLALAACGTSPEPDYYALAPVSGSAAPDIAAAIEIERPTLPAYLDRPDIVRQAGEYRIDIDEAKRWSAPLDEMLESVLAQDLRQRMPNSTVVTEKSEASPKTRFIVETDIENFNGTAEGTLLAAQILIRDSSACAAPNPQTIQFRATSSDSNLVAGLSQLAGELANRIVTGLREDNTAPSCTAADSSN